MALGQLPSWNDGLARTAILEFVERVTADGSAEFVPPPARIAVLDNDGTLWCERPTYVQAFFILERLGEQAAADPELAAQPVVRALLAGDLAGAANDGVDALAEVLLRTHADLTADEFAEAAARWLDDAVHPRFGVPYTRLAYRPMLELLDLLRSGDREMLEYATTGPLPSLAIVVDHDDELREYAYPGASFTDPRAEPIVETAARLGWTIVSMRRDWSAVFGEGIDP